MMFMNTLTIKRASSRFTELINPQHHTKSFQTNKSPVKCADLGQSLVTGTGERATQPLLLSTSSKMSLTDLVLVRTEVWIVGDKNFDLISAENPVVFQNKEEL